ACLRKDDYQFSTHRGHGHAIAKGLDLKKMAAEMLGKETGSSHGRGGSMHLIDTDKGMLGAAPIVAETLMLALGAALAASIRKEDRVAVAFFGDGATGEGVLYESMNFAALRNLPIIFACENNYYSTHLPIRECRPAQDIYKIAEPFGIRSQAVDGNDVLAVHEAAKMAVEQCRRREGPVFIEFRTYRFRGHVGPDDNIQGSHTDIRPKLEITDWLKRDPIALFEQYLVEAVKMDASVLAQIKTHAQQEVAAAILFARNSPRPAKEALMDYVYR
ncbi:MAG: thiamine pyrophosphate-dependent dehydrogenase E1 component subunit alpha, partial [Actinomycetota bacterium]